LKDSESRAQLRQHRTMRYFIEAAEEIVEKDGVKAVTVRKVAEMAGYTSATLYNYFDDLNHLIFFTAMRYLEAYRKEQAAKANSRIDAEEIYYRVLDVFIKHALAHSDIFNVLYKVTRDGKAEEYARQYYEIFPEKMPPNIDTIAWAASVINLDKRNNLYYLSPLVEQGRLTQKNANELSNLTVMTLAFFLNEVKNGIMDEEGASERCDFYVRRLMELYLNRKD
jgi:AcrR family transcriptional regulator